MSQILKLLLSDFERWIRWTKHTSKAIENDRIKKRKNYKYLNIICINKKNINFIFYCFDTCVSGNVSSISGVGVMMWPCGSPLHNVKRVKSVVFPLVVSIWTRLLCLIDFTTGYGNPAEHHHWATRIYLNYKCIWSVFETEVHLELSKWVIPFFVLE